ncbi:NAC domain-containing protein 41 [Ricinus communis]|uniref:NAC domain-containing protein 41 n=1 Tax=Ricinus communis TaxID=3988 RepID=UPI0007729229|nr:NAC domain-containing protein 41 [Ricinus communis]|eukprot:XP_015583216.1 NAC domain-containing protein 41 [Ricinus communis]
MQQLKDQIPVGYRFNPTDCELVGYYLFNKLNGCLLPIDNMLVADTNLYGKDEPLQLWEKFGGNCSFYSDGEIYLFTKLKKKGSRILRSVGAGGTWHGVDAGKPVRIKTNRGQLIEGTKKCFSYRNPNSIHDGCWIMHEFSLFDISYDWVLCRLKKNFSTDETGVSDNVPGIKKRVSSKKRKIVHFAGDFNNSEFLTSDERFKVTDVVLAEQALSGFSSNGASIAVTEQGNEIVVAEFNSEGVISNKSLKADVIVEEQSNGASTAVTEQSNQLLGSDDLIERLINTDLANFTVELLGDDQSFTQSNDFAELEPLFQHDSYFCLFNGRGWMPSYQQKE